MVAERQNLSRSQYMVARLIAKWMKFMTHFIQNDTTDGDNFFLHIQVWAASLDNAYLPCSHCHAKSMPFLLRATGDI